MWPEAEDKKEQLTTYNILLKHNDHDKQATVIIIISQL